MAGRFKVRWWMIPTGALALGGVCCGGGLLTMGPCGGLWWRYGVVEFGSSCPVGAIRLGAEVQAYGQVRGDEGQVRVRPEVRFMERHGSVPRERLANAGVSAELALLDPSEQVVEGFASKAVSVDTGLGFETTLPADLPDGDYLLRTTVRSADDEVVVDTPLALYAPALAHLVLDRPLYEPGNEVLLRSVLLRTLDQAPLEERPGTWEIRSPSGQLMWKEKDRADGWGVADAAFQLDPMAEEGTWSATWRSGDASDRVDFEVRPFRLPRFTVDAHATERWFHPGETAALEGVARYTSGAPVANATVAVDLAVSAGRWPLPVAWERTYDARTDAQGRYTVELGEVPMEDLLTREKAVLGARIRVTDETGETATGGMALTISADDIRAEVLTELNGLVGGVNNRAWVRVTTPDGVPVRNASLSVGNPYDVQGKAWEAETDEDGVARLQVDPGDPVSVVMPPVPARVRPPVVQPLRLIEARVLPERRGANLAERRLLESVAPDLQGCRHLVRGQQQVHLGLQVAGTGVVTRIAHGDAPLEVCVGQKVRGLRLPSGDARTLAVTWSVPQDLRPDLQLSVDTAYGSVAVTEVLDHASLRARRCLSPGHGRNGARVLTAHWTADEGTRVLRAEVDVAGGAGLTVGEISCIQGEFRSLALQDEATGEAMGTATLTLRREAGATVVEPEASYTSGYALEVTAAADGSELGKNTVVVEPGHVPPLRIRMTPSVAAPGEEVEIAFLRGEGFRGTLPLNMNVHAGTAVVEKLERPEGSKAGFTFQVPDDARGFLHVEHAGTRGVVFVRQADPLSLELSTDAGAYGPGDIARLTVRTRAGSRPVPASVGLIGVDATLGQLAPLVGPQDMGRVTVRATADAPAFGAFDPRALVLGEVRGPYASEAAVLRVTSIPMDHAGDQPASGSGMHTVDDLEVLTRRFWRARAAFVDRVRAWEESAPKDELLDHPRTRALWVATLDDLSGQDVPVTDAFDRRMDVGTLPEELLERLDPREVASDATRLPEDLTSWTDWVLEEQRR